ncbi:phosphofurin acidic cluster sorting protein 1 [Harmonia axyridis]|uniref:phosphofurin acidic cluster sorting protein 1 n=1 Tax=Harmonia axyridis TaxID=115357 RepID=UPI001E275D37|nr:phosphofurin acidic cluster sorting protein 1 [Harmonia axyridis]
MSEKLKIMTSSGNVPNKMRLYATWVDRTPSNCIPRLCSLTLTRLVILKPLGSELQSLSIAVKMQSTKRTLRSHELTLPSNGLLDASLDLTFCLQYPHFLKREGNKLHILLQRRKRYKNRTMLGYKTLAEGVIRMDQVLQKHMDLELELMSDNNGKEKGAGPVARLSVIQLSSTPVDQEGKTDHKYDFSDEDDEISSGEEEVGDLSDSEPLRTKIPHARHNLKQRFVSLLRRFRVADSEGGRGADLTNTSDIQALFQELESLSCDEDSGGEQDTMSISSTPKPSLRPFFSSSKSLLDSSSQTFIDTDKLFDEKAYSGSDGNAELLSTDPEIQSDAQTGSPPREPTSKSEKIKSADNDFSNIMQELTERKAKLFRSSTSSAKKKNSLSVCSDIPIFETITARKTFLEQISRSLPLEESVLPENIFLLSGPDSLINPIYSKLAHLKVFQPISAVEVKAILSHLCNKIHKYYNSCSKTGTLPFIRLILLGGDLLVGWAVRPFVELLSTKPSEWLSFLRLYIIPVGTCNIAKQLTLLDQGYATLFPTDQDIRADDIMQKLQKYISVPPTAPFAQLPVGEVMLTCYDDSNQHFIPFINEVRVGPVDPVSGLSVDLDDVTCSSPPSVPSLTPPSSPNVQVRELWEPLELQIDYWQFPKVGENVQKTEKGKPDGKISMKGLFRGIQVTPTCVNGLNVVIQLANKEKKQKIMRLGKKKEKEKDVEARSQYIEYVSRMICSVRPSHNSPLKVYVDGVEFSGVKFFQLNSTWQTHVKYVPVALVGVPLASAE